MFRSKHFSRTVLWLCGPEEVTMITLPTLPKMHGRLCLSMAAKAGVDSRLLWLMVGDWAHDPRVGN